MADIRRAQLEQWRLERMKTKGAAPNSTSASSVSGATGASAAHRYADRCLCLVKFFFVTSSPVPFCFAFVCFSIFTTI